MKNSSAEELMRAIDVVLSGEVYVSPLITFRVVQRFAGPKTQHSWSAGRS
jgi:DNA-binding NarL/FixJ family response regulator